MYVSSPANITELHIEITNKCNAACPMCDRNIFGYKDSPGLPLTEWSKDDISKVFNDEIPNVCRVYLCGTHGDPIASKNLFDIVHAIKQMGSEIEIFTNGSLKTNEWWKKFVDILDGRDKIVFGVDGIETNHLYRVNTDINKIMDHMKIVCDSEAKCQWDFLAFKHNEHELEKCKTLSEEMGVTSFRLKRTPRFSNFNPYPVFNSNKELTHYLEPPVNEEYRHPNHEKLQRLEPAIDNSFDEIIAFRESRTELKFKDQSFRKIEAVDINCHYKENKKMYINSRLEVFPCCYISDDYEKFKNLDESELRYPIGELSLKNKTWRQILDSSYFTSELENSWENGSYPHRCAKTCGNVKREQGQSVIIRDENNK